MMIVTMGAGIWTLFSL